MDPQPGEEIGSLNFQRLSRTEFYYLFGPKSAAHVQFYQAWAEAARANGVEMILLGILPDHFRSSGRERILRYMSFPHVRLIRSGRLLRARLRLFLFLLGRLVRGRRVVVQVHKFPTQPLDWLKHLAGRRLQYAISLEGDALAEREYLQQHPFRPGFYDQEIDSAPERARALRKRLSRADHILPVTDTLQSILVDRFPNIELRSKTTVMPTGFDQRQRFFSPPLRADIRRSLNLEGKFVLVYIGNIHYSWQNFSRTAAIYDLLRRNLERPTFFLLLIRQQDHAIAREFLQQYMISSDEVLLDHVSSEELTGYLNAADLGVVLRHEHTVSRAAGVPGKLGDYAGCGLPVLMNQGVPGWNAVERIDGGAVLEDMDNDEEVLRRVQPLVHYDSDRRRRIEQWAHHDLSAGAHGRSYAVCLQRLAARAWGREKNP